MDSAPQPVPTSPAAANYSTLRADKIVATAEKLRDRIAERFPDSGLGKVGEALLEVARNAADTATVIGRPLWRLRLAVGAVIGVGAVTLLAIATQLQPDAQLARAGQFIQIMEAGINDLVLIGAAIFFLVTVEIRVKRRRALKALHELRCLAHIVDMHQLTKDPERLLAPEEDTASSPHRRTMTPFELNRYLDYCSELLSLIGKLAALYAQHFDDSVALGAVDGVEDLTTGLSRKIWQKMMILRAGLH